MCEIDGFFFDAECLELAIKSRYSSKCSCGKTKNTHKWQFGTQLSFYQVSVAVQKKKQRKNRLSSLHNIHRLRKGYHHQLQGENAQNLEDGNLKD